MLNPKTFNCPSCGAALPIPPKGATGVQCPYCENTVVVPHDMRTPAPNPAETSQDLFSYLRGFNTLSPQEMRLAVLAILAFGFVALALVLNPFGRSSSASPEMLQAEQTTAAMTVLISQEMQGTRPSLSSKSKYPQPLLTFGGTGTAPGLFQDARYVAADGNGNFYVADTKIRRIQKFDAAGKYVSLWNVIDSDKNAPVNYVSALSADRAGNVYVTADNAIYKYDGASGKLVQTIRGHSYKSAIPLAEGGILAAATSNTQDDLVHLDADGKEVWHKRGIVSSQPNSKAPDPLRIAVDGLGNIFALQDDLGEIFKYTPDGKFVTRFGSKGGQPGQFHADGILYIAVDNVSNVYVSDFGALYVFDATGRFLKNYDAFDGVGGAPRDMLITPQNEIVIVQDDNKLYTLALPVP